MDTTLTLVAALRDETRTTSLMAFPELARATGVRRVLAKAEWQRPFGNFKSLGGLLAGLRALARAVGVASVDELLAGPARPLPRLICASDGNHGLAVAAAAARAGTGARIHLPRTVPATRAARIRALGAEVLWVEGSYDEAVLAAAAAARAGEGLLIPDTSPDPDDAVVADVMAGYRRISDEIQVQLEDRQMSLSHCFVQAGVGGLAAALALGLQHRMRTPRRLLVVEPAQADCVAQALRSGAPVRIAGDLHTSADMLSCGLASASAVRVLRAHQAQSLVVDEDSLHDAVTVLAAMCDVETTPSGAAGVAGLLHVAARPALRALHGLHADSDVLVVVTEGPVPD